MQKPWVRIMGDSKDSRNNSSKRLTGYLPKPNPNWANSHALRGWRAPAPGEDRERREARGCSGDPTAPTPRHGVQHGPPVRRITRRGPGENAPTARPPGAATSAPAKRRSRPPPPRGRRSPPTRARRRRQRPPPEALTDLERCFRICFLMIPAMVPGRREPRALAAPYSLFSSGPSPL